MASCNWCSLHLAVQTTTAIDGDVRTRFDDLRLFGAIGQIRHDLVDLTAQVVEHAITIGALLELGDEDRDALEHGWPVISSMSSTFFDLALDRGA